MKDFIIKNSVTIPLRVFQVNGTDKRTGETAFLTVTLSKEQLRAAQIVGQSSKELIERICERQGFYVLEIGTAKKMSVDLDLAELCSEAAVN